MTEKIVFKISNMHCVSCAMAIDMELEDLPGVVEAKTSYATRQCEAVYEPDKISAGQIFEVIKKTGYTPEKTN